MSDSGWFDSIDIDDVDAGATRIRTGSAPTPQAWPTIAIERGAVDSRSAYYERVHEAAMAALETELEAHSQAADQELIHLVRLYDVVADVVNELDQRVRDAREATEVADSESDRPIGARLMALDDAGRDLEDELEELDRATRQLAHTVAPNLTSLAGGRLAARLIAAAGGLDDLAKLPSSTVQVLGAETALFAHLTGSAPSPKHGLIFTHPAVRSAAPSDRGKAARILAGKLTIAARVDHYRGEIDPSIEEDLARRLETVSTSEGSS